MRLRDSFDIPEEVSRGPHSPTFEKFLWNWFGDTGPVTHGELDLTFLNDLTPTELDCAREMIRRNLKLRYVHIIEGASALRDLKAAPILRAMIEDEPDASRRLTMAGALWKITGDPLFATLLEHAMKIPDLHLIRAHLLQVLWLDDERAIDLLVDLLPEPFALGLLNELEFGSRAERVPREKWRSPSEYRQLRNDPTFRERMVAAIHRWNAESKNGR